MANRKSIPNGFRFLKPTNRHLLGLGLLAMACLAGGTTAYAATAAGSCDATTGASVSIIGVKTTTSSATVTWTEKRHSSSRYFCYGIGSPSKCALVTSRASGSKDQVTTGLTANTKYDYKFYGVYKNATKSIVTGTFTTDGSTCGTTVVTVVEVDGTALTSAGDSLENVIAKLTRQSDGVVVDQDTTDESGRFQFEADPGTYTISLSYPPFTAPAPYTVTVVIKKPVTVPTQILTNAFQLSGTVVSEGKGDTLKGVNVTLLKKSDNSMVATRVTNTEGRFSIGLVAGDYLLNATYQGKTMTPPMSLTITKSMILDKVILGTNTVGIHAKHAIPRAAWVGKQSPEEFDANGARRKINPNSLRVFTIPQP